MLPVVAVAFPLGHSWHVAFPATPWYFPAVQLVQIGAWGADLWPAAQLVQNEAPAAANFPPIQAKQVLWDANPWYFPAAQGPQATLGVALNVPGAHEAPHTLCPVARVTFPTAQSRHEEWDAVGLCLPVEQATQLVGFAVPVLTKCQGSWKSRVVGVG